MTENIDATAGRQLLLDDHVFRSHNLVRTWHPVEVNATNPVLHPSSDSDLNGGRCPIAAPFDDGIAFDRSTGLWKVWYMSGWFDRTHLRESVDGVDWFADEPVDLLGLPYRRDGGLLQRDGVSVCVDYTGARREYRLLRYVRQRPSDFAVDTLPHHASPVVAEGADLYGSSDGVNWNHLTAVGPCGDNTTFFYDPFRKEWVFSIRTHLGRFGRGRGWHSDSDLATAATWSPEEVVPWVASHGAGHENTVEDLPSPEIYKVTCMPYESQMLGFFAIYRGPSNDWAEERGTPKIIDLYLGSSRDGYHYSLSPRPLLVSSRRPGSWDRGYLHMVNGGLIPVDDLVRIYYTAFSGVSPSLGEHMYAGGSMGLAQLRRDGFASLGADATGHGGAESKRLRVRGEHLFVNATTGRGGIGVSVLDHRSSTHHTVTLGPGTDSTAFGLPVGLDGAYSEHDVTLEFELTGDARLYSFWFSDRSGISGGFCASGPID
ncbi:hypothetical protein [Kribbella caucasensis]|uniref:hypothetical protein n=1 Tax=Kribbella caucasensis TaxID=2512215 RepID=UPI00105C1E61|nr:hypothetical protein [Kribbella sp. VKM Ac-2527]